MVQWKRSEGRKNKAYALVLTILRTKYVSTLVIFHGKCTDSYQHVLFTQSIIITLKRFRSHSSSHGIALNQIDAEKKGKFAKRTHFACHRLSKRKWLGH